MPAPPAGIAGASSLILATTDSVVRSVEATLVAFCNAHEKNTRTTQSVRVEYYY